MKQLSLAVCYVLGTGRAGQGAPEGSMRQQCEGGLREST